MTFIYGFSLPSMIWTGSCTPPGQKTFRKKSISTGTQILL